MIAAENLDHQPQTVTLERLPDGTALLWLRKRYPSNNAAGRNRPQAGSAAW